MQHKIRRMFYLNSPHHREIFFKVLGAWAKFAGNPHHESLKTLDAGSLLALAMFGQSIIKNKNADCYLSVQSRIGDFMTDECVVFTWHGTSIKRRRFRMIVFKKHDSLIFGYIFWDTRRNKPSSRFMGDLECLLGDRR